MDTNTQSLENYLADKYPETGTLTKETMPTTAPVEKEEENQLKSQPTLNEEASKPKEEKSIEQIIQEKREKRIAKDEEIARLKTKLELSKASQNTTADQIADNARKELLKEKELDFEELELYRQERAKTEVERKVEQMDLQTRKDIQAYVKSNPDVKEVLGDRQIDSLVIFKRLNPEYERMDISAIVEDFFGPAIEKVKANLAYKATGKNTPAKPDFRNMSKQDFADMDRDPSLKAEYKKDLWARLKNSRAI